MWNASESLAAVTPPPLSPLDKLLRYLKNSFADGRSPALWLLALVVGAALAAAGVIMQALTRNPLADPGVLGVNAGAATAVAAGIALAGVQSAPAQLLCGLLGAALAGAVVVLLSGLRSGADPIRWCWSAPP